MVPNFSELTIQRICIHTIEKKESAAQKKKAGTEEVDDSASLIKYDETVIKLESDVHATLTTRLNTYCGERSKSFELDIQNSLDDSFYALAFNMREADKDAFVEKTKAMTRLLAKYQNARIPAGCLVIMDAVDEHGLPVVICIKAELTDALTTEMIDGVSHLKKIEKLILGRSEKFFKIGLIYKRAAADVTGTEPKDEWGAILYDHQFRTSSKPAGYFWRDFLGFSINSNEKLKLKLFYDSTATFIEQKFRGDAEARSRALDDLDHYVSSANVTEIDPVDFMTKYLPEDKQDDFNEDVAVNFARPFAKDTSLIDRKLAKSRYEFPDNIVLTGPRNSFTKTKVEVIETPEDLASLKVNDGYTIIRIKGNPDRFLTYDE